MNQPMNQTAYIQPGQFTPQQPAYNQLAPVQYNPNTQQTVAQPSGVVHPPAGNYDFQVVRASKFTTTKQGQRGSYTATELLLDVILVGTQDPSNPGQPYKAKLSGVNTDVKALVTQAGDYANTDTNFNKLLKAFGINLPPNTPGTSVNLKMLEGLYAHGTLNQAQPHHKRAYIQAKSVMAVQNPEILAQNASRVQQVMFGGV